MMVEATRLVPRASGITPDDGIHFPGEFFVMAGAFSMGQVLNFGSLAYITNITELTNYTKLSKKITRRGR
jgi:hypothetical protein